MGKAALKTLDKQPTLTEQIADLNTRKGQIQIGVTKINESNLTHQKRLDDAEDVLVYDYNPKRELHGSPWSSKQLNKDNSVSILFINKYNAISASMEF